MNSKITINSQLSTIKHKEIKNKNELSRQLEQEQNHRSGDHMELSAGEGKGKKGEKGTGNK